ncbi:Uncharacterized protein HZ326_9945 [Fusarium oxysporum f. sp. albedinis]|nr:Uncharacterized protein HZ326_9945 [Fusarium oxysporum f. sp. albedinis]
MIFIGFKGADVCFARLTSQFRNIVVSHDPSLLSNISIPKMTTEVRKWRYRRIFPALTSLVFCQTYVEHHNGNQLR